MQNAEGLVGAQMLMAFCPPLGMVGNVFASPVDQLAAIDVALVLLVLPCPMLTVFVVPGLYCLVKEGKAKTI